MTVVWVDSLLDDKRTQKRIKYTYRVLSYRFTVIFINPFIYPFIYQPLPMRITPPHSPGRRTPVLLTSRLGLLAIASAWLPCFMEFYSYTNVAL